MEKEKAINLWSIPDNRNESFEAYSKNNRMRTFGAFWKSTEFHGGENTWAHLGIFCRQMFGEANDEYWTPHERRLVYLGLLVGYLNSDKCNWEPKDKERALKVAWRYIKRKRPPNKK